MHIQIAVKSTIASDANVTINPTFSFTWLKRLERGHVRELFILLLFDIGTNVFL